MFKRIEDWLQFSPYRRYAYIAFLAFLGIAGATGIWATNQYLPKHEPLTQQVESRVVGKQLQEHVQNSSGPGVSAQVEVYCKVAVLIEDEVQFCRVDPELYLLLKEGDPVIVTYQKMHQGAKVLQIVKK